MYAIIVTGSKQYKVKADDLFDIERIEGEEGKEVVFDKVLAVGEEGGKLNVGAPVVEGATVKAQIVEQFRGIIYACPAGVILAVRCSRFIIRYVAQLPCRFLLVPREYNILSQALSDCSRDCFFHAGGTRR